jgi:ribosomal protein S18 acetylase RimI-like enzyme
MEIRRLNPGDASAYRAMRLRAFRDHPEAFTSSFEEADRLPLAASEMRLGVQHHKFWGAFESGRLCGMIGLERETRVKNQHKGTVVAMYVPPERTRRGIGLALLEALVEDARATGIELLVLTVTHGNGSAAKLYERAGFRSFGIEPRAIKIDGRAYAKNHMYLELTPSS